MNVIDYTAVSMNGPCLQLLQLQFHLHQPSFIPGGREKFRFFLVLVGSSVSHAWLSIKGHANPLNGTIYEP